MSLGSGKLPFFGSEDEVLDHKGFMISAVFEPKKDSGQYDH